LSWEVPTVAPTLTLDLEAISDTEREAILAALRTESDAAPEYPADTYFGAKSLYRDAQLLALASELGDTESFDRVAARLAPALEVWAEVDGCDARSERCFVYDSEWAGVRGHAPSVGSDKFNDHHFHYGYLIYAAAIAVSEGIVEQDQMAPVIDSLVADIASPGTEQVPTTRVFDPYAGHSWASGTSPFTDGNNQESSGEAVMAWTAVAAWSRLRGDDAAAARAEWMLASEAHSALALYLRPDTDFAPEYEHTVVGIQWGAKRDWATWFSADPGAMLGIQLIPLAPSQREAIAPHDDDAAAHISGSVAEAMPSGSAEQFEDLITMYGALAGGEARNNAWDTAMAFPDDAIDDGISRAYMLAFIAAS
jgi:endoglucanase Acf2